MVAGGGGKRPDLQGIRALAIAAVLLFHLRPNDFPAGYLGVDIFFVLSGFLMAVILSKDKTMTADVILGFYIRRFKRIVPLYAALVAGLCIAVPVIFLKRDVKRFLKDVSWAALFGTNIHSALEETDYWSEVFDSNVLTHTWSLGVEMQWYGLVPIVVILQRSCDHYIGGRWSILFLIILFIASFIFQLLSEPLIAFNLVPSRVWQFLAGALVHTIGSVKKSSTRSRISRAEICQKEDVAPLLEEGNDDEEEIKDEKKGTVNWGNVASYLIIFMLLVLIIGPISAPAWAQRLCAVAAAALLIGVGKDENAHCWLISMKPMVYLGDLSYVVYLVHWPVITAWKSYFDLMQLDLQDCLLCLLITFSVSVIAHHTLESCFIRSSTLTAFIFVSILYLGMVAYCMSGVPLQIAEKHQMSSESPNVTEAIAWNKHEAHIVYYARRPFKECVDDPEGNRMAGKHSVQKPYECAVKGNGNLEVLVLGNSISHRSSAVLHDILKGKFRTFRLFAHSGCNPLLPSCSEFFASALQLMKNMKPNVTFFILNRNNRMIDPIVDIETDSGLVEFRAFIGKITNLSQFVVHDELYPLPTKSVGVAESLMKRLIRHQPLDAFKGDLKGWQNQNKDYFRRLNRIQFPNFFRVNTSAPLCAEDPGICWWYNRKNLHAYFTDNVHLSPEGLNLLRPSYKSIISKLFPGIFDGKKSKMAISPITGKFNTSTQGR